jgi:hypothetical protein
MESVMLEHYYLKPSTIDRIRDSWLGSQIENYSPPPDPVLSAHTPRRPPLIVAHWPMDIAAALMTAIY